MTVKLLFTGCVRYELRCFLIVFWFSAYGYPIFLALFVGKITLSQLNCLGTFAENDHKWVYCQFSPSDQFVYSFASTKQS